MHPGLVNLSENISTMIISACVLSYYVLNYCNRAVWLIPTSLWCVNLLLITKFNVQDGSCPDRSRLSLTITNKMDSITFKDRTRDPNGIGNIVINDKHWHPAFYIEISQCNISTYHVQTPKDLPLTCTLFLRKGVQKMNMTLVQLIK